MWVPRRIKGVSENKLVSSASRSYPFPDIPSKRDHNELLQLAPKRRTVAVIELLGGGGMSRIKGKLNESLQQAVLY